MFIRRIGHEPTTIHGYSALKAISLMEQKRKKREAFIQKIKKIFTLKRS